MSGGHVRYAGTRWVQESPFSGSGRPHLVLARVPERAPGVDEADILGLPEYPAASVTDHPVIAVLEDLGVGWRFRSPQPILIPSARRDGPRQRSVSNARGCGKRTCKRGPAFSLPRYRSSGSPQTRHSARWVPGTMGNDFVTEIGQWVSRSRCHPLQSGHPRWLWEWSETAPVESIHHERSLPVRMWKLNPRRIRHRDAG